MAQADPEKNSTDTEDSWIKYDTKSPSPYFSYDYLRMRDHYPPRHCFYDLLSESDQERFALLWLRSLFFKHGLISEQTMSEDKGYIWEESLYCFVCNGVPGYWLYDDRMNCFSCFAVDGDYVDQRDRVAETIRDLIIRDGSNITLEDWQAVRSAYSKKSAQISSQSVRRSGAKYRARKLWIRKKTHRGKRGSQGGPV